MSTSYYAKNKNFTRNFLFTEILVIGVAFLILLLIIRSDVYLYLSGVFTSVYAQPQTLGSNNSATSTISFNHNNDTWKLCEDDINGFNISYPISWTRPPGDTCTLFGPTWGQIYGEYKPTYVRVSITNSSIPLRDIYDLADQVTYFLDPTFFKTLRNPMYFSLNGTNEINAFEMQLSRNAESIYRELPYVNQFSMSQMRSSPIVSSSSNQNLSALLINSSSNQLQPTAAQNQTTASQNQTTASQNQTTAAQNQTTAAQNQTTAAQNQTTAAQNQTTAAQNQTTAAQNQTTAAQNQTTAAQNQTTASQNQTNEAPTPAPTEVPDIMLAIYAIQNTIHTEDTAQNQTSAAETAITITAPTQDPNAPTQNQTIISTIYVIEYVAPEDRFDYYLPWAIDMINSFRIAGTIEN